MSAPAPSSRTGDPDSRQLLELAERVARDAGRLVAAARKGEVEVTQTKSSPTDIVTAADIASEALIRREIFAARPNDGLLGEEGDDIAGSSGVMWVADPIDGTVNFLYGLPQYSISIAAHLRGEPVAGVVHNPVSGETFTATAGGGARLDGRPIHVSDCRDLSSALVGTGFTYRADVRALQAPELARLVPHVRDIRRLGSAALDLCFVACGRLDGYAERGLKPWDYAAGMLIAQEAGATVAGLGGDPVSERLIVAAPTGLFPALEIALVAAGFADFDLPGWPG